MTFIQTILLGLVEGITEFLPVSSTGHLILTSHFLGLTGEKIATFEIFIQLGAILSVVVMYRQRFQNLFLFKSSAGFSGLRGLLLLIITTFPALLLGAITHQYIKIHLFTPLTVAVGLGLGGLALLIGEKLIHPEKTKDLDTISWKQALAVGFFQCLALWPGISRSAATIMGGMISGVERKTATEYSFFAAVPVMCAAVFFDLYKSLPLLNFSDIPQFALGFFVAFFSAWAAIRLLIKIVSSRNLTPFGWYRILVAILVLWFLR